MEQDEFLNGALLLKTLFTPYELLDELHVIEQSAGRERIVHWGPRTLDLDILFYDDMILDTEELTIPHAEIALRDFVLEPMDQIAPCFRHPVLNKTIRQLRSCLLYTSKLQQIICGLYIFLHSICSGKPLFWDLSVQTHDPAPARWRLYSAGFYI